MWEWLPLVLVFSAFQGVILGLVLHQGREQAGIARSLRQLGHTPRLEPTDLAQLHREVQQIRRDVRSLPQHLEFLLRPQRQPRVLIFHPPSWLWMRRKAHANLINPLAQQGPGHESGTGE